MSSHVFSSLALTYLCSSSSSSSSASASKSAFDGVYATAHDAEVYASILSQATTGNHSCVGRKPILVAQPASVGDVKRVLALTQAWVREGNGNVDAPPLCICGGGHSELCVLEGAILLHMKRLNDVHVDVGAQTVTIGPGVTLGDVQEEAAKHGMAVPTGVFSGVGVGSILMGGVGRLARKHGLSVQNVVELDMVTADGELHTLNAEAKGLDAELFWAARGAAPALGVVTRIVVRAFNVSPDVVYGTAVVRLPPSAADRPLADAAADKLAGIERILRSLPEGQQVDLCLAPPTSAASDAGGIRLGIFPCSIDGPFCSEDGEAIGFDVTKLGTCRFCDIPYHSMEEDADASPGADTSSNDVEGAVSQASAGVFSYVRQRFVDELGEEGMAILAAAASEAPTGDSLIMLQHCGGATRRGGSRGLETPRESLAFTPHDWEFSVVIIALWTDTSDDARRDAMRWADGAFNALQSHGAGLYAVDIDPFRRPSSTHDEVMQAYGDANLRRLRDLKQKVDPLGLFRGTVKLQ